MDLYHVYTIQHKSGYYPGCTKNLKDRIARHNRGSLPATKNYRPINLVSCTSFMDKYKAILFERYLKTGSGRAFLKRHRV